MTRTLNSIGFESGVSNPALLHCEKLDASMVVRGDDFITLGDSEALSEIEREMRDHYTIKVRAVLGAERDDAKEVRILNTCAGTPMVDRVGLSMNQTLDMQS